MKWLTLIEDEEEKQRNCLCCCLTSSSQLPDANTSEFGNAWFSLGRQRTFDIFCDTNFTLISAILDIFLLAGMKIFKGEELLH